MNIEYSVCCPSKRKSIIAWPLNSSGKMRTGGEGAGEGAGENARTIFIKSSGSGQTSSVPMGHSTSTLKSSLAWEGSDGELGSPCSSLNLDICKFVGELAVPSP